MGAQPAWRLNATKGELNRTLGKRRGVAFSLEVCVDNSRDLALAVGAGVDRIELCRDLSVGGLTPTDDLIAVARAAPIPVYAMIRPRAGDFCFSRADLDLMADDITKVRAAGLAGVVLGVATATGALDTAALGALAERAHGLGRTLHRVVDTLADPAASLAPAMALGFERILTSGGKDTACEGAATLARMCALAGENLEIMAGGGVRADQIDPLLQIGCRSFHASCIPANATGQARRIDRDELAKLLGKIRSLIPAAN